MVVEAALPAHRTCKIIGCVVRRCSFMATLSTLFLFLLLCFGGDTLLPCIHFFHSYFFLLTLVHMTLLLHALINNQCGCPTRLGVPLSKYWVVMIMLVYLVLHGTVGDVVYGTTMVRRLSASLCCQWS